MGDYTEALRQRRRYQRVRVAAGKPPRRKGHAPRIKQSARSFVGVDGEGCGTDDAGRQHYMLLRAGERELFTGEPLRTLQCLEFIASLPPDRIYIGFAFGYDTTMILRDLPKERLDRLFAPFERATGLSPYTWFHNKYGLEYLPKNYLRVVRLDARNRAIPGSSRTIWETFGNFQKSFVKSLDDYRLAPDAELDRIAENKARRGKIEAITDEEREYCRMECEYLASMMETFRANAWACGIKPKRWSGAGKLANAMHASHGTMKAKHVSDSLPPDLQTMAQHAYYGGRFEISRTGLLDYPVHQYDLRSAYPAAMLDLPCLEHGQWIKASPAWLRRAPRDALFVSQLRFDHTGDRNFHGLPVRLPGLTKEQRQTATRMQLANARHQGKITWPKQGNGFYWSPEIRSAEKLGVKVFHKTGWRYVKTCDCCPFSWVSDVFAQRMKLGKDAEGYALKLAINALYGLLAQRVGTPEYANPVWASLITAITRARLNEAIALAPDDIVMIATDAVLSKSQLPLIDTGTLGGWEYARHDTLFVWQPGLYWGPRPTGEAMRKLKTRGASMSFFMDRTMDDGREIRPTDAMERAWLDYADAARAAVAGRYIPPPVYGLDVELFIGLRLAWSRGKPEEAGKWVRTQKAFSSDWSGKRGVEVWETATSVWHRPPPGSRTLMSAPHKGDLYDQAEIERMELDEQPDRVVTGGPFTLE